MDRDRLAQERVAAGARWLDAYAGPGWESRIDVPHLCMWLDGRCVLGQLWQSFVHAKAWFRLSDRDCIDRGFVTSRCLGDPDVHTFEELRDVWVREIKTRLAGTWEGRREA